MKDSSRVTSAVMLAVGRGDGEGTADPGDSDAGLLRRVAGGDQQALAGLYQRHGRIVLAQIYLVTGDRAVSEEILQDTSWPRGAGPPRSAATPASGRG